MQTDIAISISEGWLAGLFIVSVTSLVCLAKFVGSARRAARQKFGEEGVSYSLSFVLTLPFIMMFCCIVIECVMISVTKLGVSYAAYAGARSATVWMSAKPASVRSERVEHAVLTALAPFTIDRFDGPFSPALVTKSFEVRTAYSRLISGSDATKTVPAQSMARRYRYAGSKTSIDVQDNTNTTVKVTYRYRCLLGWAGRILDPDHRAPFEIVIESQAVIPSEKPPTGNLGIDYHSE